ncbi:hypothetical protein GYMLUDRAFT_413229 [Collybiopsis luxurians FD-317 M1]|nr:hypothetical protein GYMLUDRAFT_413229 [Collybiopsis luxurians FD-317 M1]
MGVDATLGVFEIGILVSTILFGIVTAQVYVYHRNFPDESLWIKYGVVDAMWLVELGHTICTFHMLYFYTISHYGDPTSIGISPPSLGAAIILHGIIIIFGRLYLPIFSIILLFCQVLAITTLGSQLIIVATKSSAKFEAEWSWLIFTLLGVRAVADITITGTMVYYLRTRRKAAIKRTILLLDKLILWSLETGVVISVVGFSSMILASFIAKDKTLSKSYLWLALIMVVPKVFSNTMMANINSRMDLRRAMPSSVEISTGALAIHNRIIPMHANTSRAVNIAVHTEVEVEAAGAPWSVDSSVHDIIQLDAQKSSLAIE